MKIEIDLDRTITVRELVAIAANLKSEHGENPEYDRALAEMVIDAAGLSMEQKVEVMTLIGIGWTADRYRLASRS